MYFLNKEHKDKYESNLNDYKIVEYVVNEDE